MKTKNLFLMYSLLAGLGLMPDFRLTAQTFTTLHSFSATSGEFSGATNSDGVYPADGVIQSGNILYGTAVSGGGSGYGTVYSLNTDGTGFTNVHTFDGYPGDGDHPYAGLLSVGDTLYGTTVGGGNRGWGTVFAISTNGTGLSILHSFTSAYGSPNVTNSDGAGPYGYGGLIRSGYTLYGTAFGGGSSGHGVVFRVNTDGTGFTNLHSFTAGSGGYPIVTNSDGAYPLAGLTLSGSALFGAAESGGTSGNGTVFAVNTDGSGFTTVHSFAAGSSSYPHTTNSDGAQPLAALVLAGSTLYGTANSGGDWGNGTVFAVNTNGSGFTILHSFTAGSGTYPTVTNSDGANPFGGLILSGNTLYGTPLEFIAQHTVWDGGIWRQLGQRHRVQSFVQAATDNHSFRSIRCLAVADQLRRFRLHRVHRRIHREPGFTGCLDHRVSGAGRGRGGSSCQSRLRRTAVLQVKRSNPANRALFPQL